MYGVSDPYESQWVSIVPSRGPGRMRLFCLPFAGGGAVFYHARKNFLPPDVELARIKLPGREARLREKAFTDMGALIAELTEVLTPWLDRPYVLFGHSMGALIAFELSRALRARHRLLPLHLFVSGFWAPHLQRPERLTGLPDAQFIARLREYGGIPELVLRNPELMEIFLPIFRSDFEMIDSYTYRPADPLDCPLTAFGGESDPKIPLDRISAWHVHTSRGFKCHFLPGGHFFINESQSRLLELLWEDLAGVINPPADQFMMSYER
jgi:surfactin synthase thioesterase subunit